LIDEAYSRRREHEKPFFKQKRKVAKKKELNQSGTTLSWNKRRNISTSRFIPPVPVSPGISD
jgi:hypothetical protein